MPTMTSYPEGLFSWVDLVAHDLDAAKGWYAELFGWNPTVVDTGGGPPYVMFQKDGHVVAGAGQMSDEMKGAGIPPMWNSYVTVEDAAATEAKAKQLGATITVPTMQVMDAGSMCFLQDPTGASLGLWQPGRHTGAGLVNEPGSLCWNELATRDVEAAKRFYAELLGWSYETSPMPDGEYTSISIPSGRQNGGIIAMVGEHWGEVPPHWMTYFAVANLDDALARLEGSRGEVRVPTITLPGVGRFSVVADPQGGTFTMIELSSEPS